MLQIYHSCLGANVSPLDPGQFYSGCTLLPLSTVGVGTCLARPTDCSVTAAVTATLLAHRRDSPHASQEDALQQDGVLRGRDVGSLR